MNTIHIMLNELKIISRNRTGLILLLVMPIAMIALMGYALKPVFEAQEKGIQKFAVLYINRDSGQIGKAFDTYIKAAGKGLVDLVSSDAQDIDGALSSGNLPAAILVSEGLSDRLSGGEKAQIEVVGSGKDALREGVVQSLVDGFTGTMNTQLGIGRGYKRLQVPDKSYGEWIQAAASMEAHSSAGFVAEGTVERPASAKLSSFQYFSITILVFFLLSAGMGLGASILNDRNGKTFMRINAYPVTANQYLLGKALGNACIGMVQALAVTAFTAFAFNIRWNNYAGLAIVILLVISISSGIAVIFSNLINSSKALSAVLTALFWTITFMSGGFMVIPLLDPVSKYIVNKWAFEAMAGFLINSGFKDTVNYLVLLAVASLVLWGVGIALYRRRVTCE